MEDSMRGLISFHPVDLDFFRTVIEPLASGEKIDPDAYLNSALGARSAAWESLRYKAALESYFELLVPPEPPADGGMWQKIRARLEELDFTPDPTAKLIGEKVDPELHLYGRPFLITEGSADSVSSMVDRYREAQGEAAVRSLLREQLARIGPKLPDEVEPAEIERLSADMVYRRELLAALKEIYDMAAAARSGKSSPLELPWRSLLLHSRLVPFWIGRDVDGLETICRAAGVEPPDCLAPAWRPFARTCEEFPALREALGFELDGPRDLGAFVSPDEIGELLTFLNTEGARLIQAAARHGDGPTCTTLLRKIRECASYAVRNGFGYLEASGIRPPEFPPEEGDET
jgi:hypothetical protein